MNCPDSGPHGGGLRRLGSDMKRTRKQFGRDASGSVTIIAAFGMTAALAAIGLAVDYSRVTNAKTKLSAATDAAALNRPGLAGGHLV